MKISKILFVTMLTAFAFSCSNDLDNPEAGSELDSVTVKTIVNTSELSAFADTILTDIFQSGVSGKSAKTNDCYTSETDGLVTTITFTDCVVENSELVNGTISATYFVDGNTIGLRITYTNLTVGENQITGTREMVLGEENDMGQTSIHIDSDITVVLEDDTIVVEEGSKVIWYTASSSQEQTIAIDGAWTVTTNGKTYNVAIERSLETTLPCEYISAGLMIISEDDASASVDFGDGTCDDLAMFTYPNGTTVEFNLRD